MNSHIVTKISRTFAVDYARRRSFHLDRQHGIRAEHRVTTRVHVEFAATHHKYGMCQVVRSAHSHIHRVLRASRGLEDIESDIGGNVLP